MPGCFLDEIGHRWVFSRTGRFGGDFYAIIVIRLLGRNAPNRRRRPEEGHHGVPFDRKRLTSDQCWRVTVAQEIITKLPDSTFAAGIPDVNSMASTFADILRQTAADTLPRRPKRPSSRGFSESPRAQARLRQARNVRERVRERLRARPQDPSLKKALKAIDKAFKRAKHAEQQSFCVSTPPGPRTSPARGTRQGCTSTSIRWSWKGRGDAYQPTSRTLLACCCGTSRLSYFGGKSGSRSS